MNEIFRTLTNEFDFGLQMFNALPAVRANQIECSQFSKLIHEKVCVQQRINRYIFRVCVLFST